MGRTVVIEDRLRVDFDTLAVPGSRVHVGMLIGQVSGVIDRYKCMYPLHVHACT